MPTDTPMNRERSAYVGWWAAGIFLVVTFVASAVVWFIFHP